MNNMLDFLAEKNTLPEEYVNMSEAEMKERVTSIKERFGTELFIPAHHYQKDEIVQFADATGDSLQLAQLSQNNRNAKYIVFCGVHFMAETAAMLAAPEQTVLLPDLRAGCSLADMADIQQTERSWELLTEIFGETIIPLTYVNSKASIKAFVGKRDGATVTSSNAKKIISWALTQKERILFLPDQHLGRNVSYELGVPLEQMAVWNPNTNELEYDGDPNHVKIILWKGHCSVHENFTVENVQQVRAKDSEFNIIVHPECPYETVAASDYVGSTSYIIKTIEAAPPGSKWAIGTEMNLVNRLKQLHKDKEIISLNPFLCACMTMNRITLPYLLWSLESIETGNYVHKITVDAETTKYAKFALNKMLANL